MAPAVQGFWLVWRGGRVRSCVRPVDAALMAAGPDGVRGSGPKSQARGAPDTLSYLDEEWQAMTGRDRQSGDGDYLWRARTRNECSVAEHISDLKLQV